jgi:hypothetical protein
VVVAAWLVSWKLDSSSRPGCQLGEPVVVVPWLVPLVTLVMVPTCWFNPCSAT